MSLRGSDIPHALLQKRAIIVKTGWRPMQRMARARRRCVPTSAGRRPKCIAGVTKTCCRAEPSKCNWSIAQSRNRISSGVYQELPRRLCQSARYGRMEQQPGYFAGTITHIRYGRDGCDDKIQLHHSGAVPCRHRWSTSTASPTTSPATR
ncbi:MAG: hypothetical protein GPOALKHO_000810 [Sodalis sp.]|nr:MAG: hypothetical protein GPOALKHO_000810 [Sodalis sp.]